MMDDNIFNLYSKSDKFWLAYITGGMNGRKLKLWNYFRSYFSFFYQLATNLFKYDGLDYKLVKEIERRLFYFGKVGVILHDKRLAAVNANTYEPDIYGRPTAFTFSFMNGDKDDYNFNRYINIDGVLGINTYEMLPTSLIAEHYAFLAAHADTTIAASLVNMRVTDVFKAGTQSHAERAKAFINGVYNGDQQIIIDADEDIEINRPTSSGAGLSARETLEVRDRYLRDFFNIIGVNRFEEKKERVVVDEVNANEPMLKLDIADMLEMRREMCRNIKRVFGIECYVVPVVDVDGDGIMEGGDENAI